MGSMNTGLFFILVQLCLTCIKAYSDCSQFRVEKICNLPTPFLPKVDTQFYKKFVSAQGIPIMGSDNTPDIALVDAARVISGIMDRLKPGIAEALTRRQQRIVMFGPNETSCSLPEQAGPLCKPSTNLGLSYGNIVSIPYIKEQCENQGHGPYAFLIHEFGHAVNSVFFEIDKKLQNRLNTAYMHAKDHSIWPKNTYTMTNVAEYFTLCWTAMWFKVNHNCQLDPSYCSRDKCAERDPVLASIVMNLLHNPFGNFLDLECSQQCGKQTVRKYFPFEDCHKESTFDTVKLQNVATGKYLDSTAKGEPQTLPISTGFYQKWKTTMPSVKGHDLQIINIATGLALEADIKGKVFTSMWNKENVHQQWRFTENKTLQCVGSNQFLGSNDKGYVFTISRNEDKFQKWNVK